MTGLDAFGDSAVSRDLPARVTPQVAERVALGRVAHLEERLGVPTFFWAGRDPRAPAPRALGLGPLEAARRHLFEHAELYRALPAALAELPLEHLHDTGRGAIIATFSKYVSGRPVFRDAIRVIMDRQLRLVALSGYVSPHAATKQAFRLATTTAASVAFTDASGRIAAPGEFAEREQGADGWVRLEHFPVGLRAEGELRLATMRAREVLFGLPDRLVPAYHLELDVAYPSTTDGWMVAYVVSAVDGRILFRHGLTQDSYSYRVWAETTGSFIPFDGPAGHGGSPHPTALPDRYQAPFTSPSLVTLANSPFSQNDPWLPTGATQTSGNNVQAYRDAAAPNGFTGGSADTHATTTSAATFDHTYDPLLAPNANATQTQAAITNLFFVTNFLHDWFYDSGFDETAGNAQTDNFGRGGAGNDSLMAEGQDYSGVNNANMSTPSDGSRPRMQMYMFRDPRWLQVKTPASIAGDYAAAPATFGPTRFDVNGDVKYVADSSGSFQGCSTFAPGTFAAAIALVDDGPPCSDAVRVQNAAAAGALAVLVASAGSAANLTGTPSQPLTVGALAISSTAANAIKGQLAAGTAVDVNAWREAAPDGTLDNAIVAHEWGHFISNRLVSNSVGLSTNQARSMGEGWGDFHSLLMLVREADAQVSSNANFAGVYGMGAYATPYFTRNNYYFGIRRVPYSTDLAKNGLTFKHVQDGTALPTSHPILAFGNNAEVHNSGEVWCSMLWEAYAALLNDTTRLTFAQAQERMRDYLVAAYKATPTMPTFIEARDALLAVAFAGDQDDFELMAAAFAKRGAGIGAAAPPRFSTDHIAVVESFLTGNDVAFATATVDDEAFYCDRDGILDGGETGVLRIALKNVGHGTMTQLTGSVTSTTPGVTIANNGQLTFPSVAPYGVTIASINVSLAAASSVMSLDFEVEFDDPTLVIPGPRTQSFSLPGNWDDVANASATETVEAPSSPWTSASASGLTQGTWERRKESGINHVFAGPDLGAPSIVRLVSPSLVVGTSAFSFTFKHRHSFEFDGTFWDGGVIEISTNGGASWTDIGSSASPGYNGTLPNGNPLGAGRAAFGSKNSAWPNFETVTVSLGTTYQGQTVQIRFSIGTDAAVAAEGWEIDDIAFSGITNTPFSERAIDDGICINRPPFAATTDQTVDERTLVTLDTSLCSDPDGDPLTFQWTQTAGPPVALASGTFEAPEVTGDTELVFELLVSDGALTSGPVTSRVLVRHVNRAPVAIAGEATEFPERSTATLDGSATVDLDGDPLTYAWTQISGTPVQLVADPSSPVATFATPEVARDEVLFFSLVATDAELSSEPSTIAVAIRNVNRPPQVTITPDGPVEERSKVVLTAAASDPDEGSALRYRWSQLEGPALALGGVSSATLEFDAPEVVANAVVILQAEVSDDDPAALSSTASVRLEILQVNRAPVASAGSVPVVPAGSTFELNGSASVDPDGDALTYRWRQVSGPTVEIAAPDSVNSLARAPIADDGAELVFELDVSDGATTSTDRVVAKVGSSRLATGCGCGEGAGAPLAVLAAAWMMLARRLRRDRRSEHSAR